MPKSRIEAFSDGVIAIVITLLVLEIHPPALPHDTSSREFAAALANLLVPVLACVTSFLVCAVWWIAHHNFMHDLVAVDRRLLWLNVLFLLCLAFIPLPTALLGEHPRQPLAAAIYGGVCALAGLSFALMRHHASFGARLMRSTIGAVELRRRRGISFLSPTLYTAGAVVSFALPVAALAIYLAIPLFFAFFTLTGPERDGPDRETTE